MVRWLITIFFLSATSGLAQLQEFNATIPPRAGENVAQPCEYYATFPAGTAEVKAAWIIYDRGPDITRFYSDSDVLGFAKRNDLAMVLASQCPAKHWDEKGEMDLYPEHGLGRSLFTALGTIGKESGHPELSQARLIVLGFSGTGAYFGHFVTFAPDRVLAAILTNPGTNEPNNLNRIRLDKKAAAVPELIVVGGIDTISGTSKPYEFFKHLGGESASVYVVQNMIPHCCINNTKPFMLHWLDEVIHLRQPDPKKPLLSMNINHGWFGSFKPCKAVYKDHWGLPLWNVCDAHIAEDGNKLPSDEMPAGFFPSESLAREWLMYIKQPNHPKNSFPRPEDPWFGAPEELLRSRH